MEKFYIVTNPEFLKEIEDYKANTAAQKVLVNEFFNDYGITGSEYHVCGNGFVNTSFTERDKHNIRLYILGCEENNEKFGKELLKPVKLFCDSDVKMRSFRANSKTLKAFHCIMVDTQHLDSNTKKSITYRSSRMTVTALHPNTMVSMKSKAVSIILSSNNLRLKRKQILIKKCAVSLRKGVWRIQVDG